MGALLERERWGLILAGGEGVRLRGLTRAITGEACPKQFCAPLGGETLLEQTRRRAALVIPPARTVVTLTRGHERFYRTLLGGMPKHCAVIEPESRGTAPSIRYGLARIAKRAPTGAVAVFPSDHYISDASAFMAHVAAAFGAVQARPDLLVLLGITPRSTDTEYGWIEPGPSIPGTGLRRVRTYREKPDRRCAEALLENGGLWNTFVIVGRVPTFLAVIRRTVPALDAAFEGLDACLDTPHESTVARALYRHLGPRDFSEAILAARPANLVVMPVAGVEWSDWGEPRRVIATLAALGITPDWLNRHPSGTTGRSWCPARPEPSSWRNTA